MLYSRRRSGQSVLEYIAILPFCSAGRWYMDSTAGNYGHNSTLEMPVASLCYEVISYFPVIWQGETTDAVK
jgi:hypothetical protein